MKHLTQCVYTPLDGQGYISVNVIVNNSFKGYMCNSKDEYKVDVGIMGHLSSSVNFLGCDYWKKARFIVLHNKDMEILKIKLFQ